MSIPPFMGNPFGGQPPPPPPPGSQQQPPMMGVNMGATGAQQPQQFIINQMTPPNQFMPPGTFPPPGMQPPPPPPPNVLHHLNPMHFQQMQQHMHHQAQFYSAAQQAQHQKLIEEQNEEKLIEKAKKWQQLQSKRLLNNKEWSFFCLNKLNFKLQNSILVHINKKL